MSHNSEPELVGSPQIDPVIVEVRSYSQHPSGLSLAERRPVDDGDELPDWVPRYSTTVIHRIEERSGKTYQKVREGVRVPALNLRDAFLKLPGIVDAVSKELHAEMVAEITRKTLILPGDPRFRK